MADLKISKINDIGGDHARVLVHGVPGSGKTTLLGSMATAGPMLYLYFAGEEGIGSLRGIEGAENIDLVRVTNLTEITEITRMLVKGDHPYVTIGVDSVSALQQMWMDDLLKKGGFAVRRSQATKDFDFWGTVKEGLEEFFTFWYGLADHGRAKPLHVVMTAQTEEREFNGETKFVPFLQGKAWKTLLARADHIYYTHLTENENDFEKYDHVVRVKPSAHVYAKLRVPPHIGEKVPDVVGRNSRMILPKFLAQIGTPGLPAPAKKTPTKKKSADADKE